MMRVDLLGPPRVTVGEVTLRIGPPRAAALVWFLASQPEQRFTRDEMVALLWDTGSESEGRARLNTTLHRLRQILPLWPIRSDRRTVAWEARSDVVIDVAHFRALANNQGRTEHALDRRLRLMEAVALWRGPFLAGFELGGASGFEEWVHRQRRLWEERVLDVWDELVHLDAELQDWASVRRHALEALQVDFWQERFHRWVMSGLWRMGDRPAALAHFEHWQARLSEEWEVTPDPETLALAETIRRERASSSRPEDPGQPPSLGWHTVQRVVPLGRSAPPVWEPPWVGREAECKAVLQTLNEVLLGGPRLVVVQGLSGIGKSRFLRRVCEELCSEGSPVRVSRLVWANCYETTAAVPYAPWAVLMRAGLDFSVFGGLEGRFQEALARLVPELGMGAPPATEETAGDDRARWLCEGVVRYWGTLPGLVLLVIDDFHWADAASWTVLTYLVTADLRNLAILVSIRSEETAWPWQELLAEWRRSRLAVRIALEPLRREDLQQMMAALAPQVGLQRVDLMWDQTAGHPLFVTAILREWVLEGRGRQAPESLGEESFMPASISEAVEAWLSRLSRPARALVEALSVFPAPPAFELLRRVARLSERMALEVWGELVGRAVVREEESPAGQGLLYSRFGGARVRLCHDIVRQVVSQKMSRAVWQALHGRVLSALRGFGQEDAWDASCLAYHAGEAGLFDEAARWAVVAAQAAERVGAYTEAVRWLEQASAHLHQLAWNQERRRRWVDIRLRLALLAWHTAPKQAVDVIEGLESEAEDEFTGEQGLAWWTRRTEGLMIGGRLQQATQLVERLLPWALRLGRPGLEGMVRLRLAQLHALAGNLSVAVAGFEASAPLLEAAELPLWYAQCLGTWASTLATLGEFSRAQAVIEALEHWPQAQDHPMVSLLASLHALTIYTQQERWTAALEMGHRFLSALRPGDHDALEYIGLIFLGLPAARLGDWAGGVGLLQRAIALGVRLGMRILLDRAYAYLAEVWRDGGQWEQARAAAEEGLHIAQRDGYRFGEVMNLRVLHSLSASKDEAVRGIESTRQAFAAMGALPEVARCHRLLAGLAEGRMVRQRQLKAAKALYKELGMSWESRDEAPAGHPIQ